MNASPVSSSLAGLVAFGWSSVRDAPFDNAKSRLIAYDRHVVGHYRLGQPFQRERADFFERYGLLDRDGHSLSDKDLTVLGLCAKTRGEIAHGADRRIAGAFRKADLTERRVTLGDPSTKPEQSATSAPAGDQVPAASRIATAILTARSAGLGHGIGSLKNTMIPSPEN